MVVMVCLFSGQCGRLLDRPESNAGSTRVAAVEGCCRTYGSGGSVVMVAEGGVATGQAADGPRVGV